MPVRAFIDSDMMSAAGQSDTILVLMPVRAFIDSDKTRAYYQTAFPSAS